MVRDNIFIIMKKKYITHVFSCNILECSWSDQDYQLAWWAWKKWRYHQMTSLRVNIDLLNRYF